MTDLLERVEWRIAVAVAIGLLAGAEREQRKTDAGARPAAGVRTFALTALLGAVVGQIDSAALWATGLVAVTAMAAAAYFLGDRSDPGITTEVALVLVFALGLLAQTRPLPALAAGVVASMLLAVRKPLHRLVREVLTPRELVDALTFAFAAVVVLPLVPDRPIDPWGAVNPFVLWRLAVLVMAITGLGYVALRWAGPRYGLFFTGLAGGFVSSSATIASMGGRARHDPSVVRPAIAGAAASTIATFVYVGLLIFVASPGLFQATLPTIAAGGLAALVFAVVETRRTSPQEHGAPTEGRAFRWQQAVGFTLLVAAVTLVAVLLRRTFGESGVLVGAAVAGFADAHAASSAVAAMTVDGTISRGLAEQGILLTITTNTVTKVVLAFSAGPRPFAKRVTVGLLLVLASASVASLW